MNHISRLLLVPFVFSACAPQRQAPVATPDKVEVLSPSVPAETLALSPPPAAGFDSGFSPVTQTADVEESGIESVMHVRAGVQGGDGSEERPFGSLNAARDAVLRILETETPVKLRIGPGMYREDVSGFLRLKDSSEAVQNTVLVIEGAPDGQTVLSGSEVFTAAWEPWEGDDTLWVAEWPHEWEPDPGPWVATFGHPEIRDETARREALVVDGTSLRLRAIEKWSWHQPGGAPGAEAGGRPLGRVNPGSMRFEGMLRDSVAEVLRHPGEFTVVSHPEAPEALRGRVFVRRAPGEGPPQNVEIPMLRHPEFPFMRIAYKNNLVLRNLTFTHANGGYLSSALLIANAHNLLIEDCRFFENVNTGLNIQRSEKVTLRRVVAEYNGQKGMGIGGTRNLLFEDTETSYNNTRGHWTNFRRWDPAGIKLGGSHQVEFRRHTAIGNYGGGIWWDVYCTDMLVDRSLLYGNGRLGVEMELAAPKEGNWEIRNSIVAWNTGAGAFISMAANTRVLNNVLAHNGGGELEAEISWGQVVFKVRRHKVKGPKSAEEWQSVLIRDNLMYADEGQHFITFLRRNIESEIQVPYVLDILEIDHNRYLSAASDAGFGLIDPQYGNFDEWVALLETRRPGNGNETSSIRETGVPPDLSVWAKILDTPWDAEKIKAWHSLRESGTFDLKQFGL